MQLPRSGDMLVRPVADGVAVPSETAVKNVALEGTDTEWVVPAGTILRTCNGLPLTTADSLRACAKVAREASPLKIGI